MIGMVALRKKGAIGSPCVVVEKVDDSFVMVDDGVKKQRINLSHLEFVEKTVSTKNIREELLGLGYEVKEKKQDKQKQTKPVKATPAKPAKPKATKKK